MILSLKEDVDDKDNDVNCFSGDAHKTLIWWDCWGQKETLQRCQRDQMMFFIDCLLGRRGGERTIVFQTSIWTNWRKAWHKKMSSLTICLRLDMWKPNLRVIGILPTILYICDRLKLCANKIHILCQMHSHAITFFNQSAFPGPLNVTLFLILKLSKAKI